MNSNLGHRLVAISELANCNPFSPVRFELEKRILGSASEPLDSIAWHRTSTAGEAERPNVLRIQQLATQVVEELASDSASELLSTEEMRDAYWNVATYCLLYRHVTPLSAATLNGEHSKSERELASSWQSFWGDYPTVFRDDIGFTVSELDAAHLFACLLQIHRAFFNIFDNILGQSSPIAKLREQVWDSIFTKSLKRYHDVMFDRMRDFSTLITGPSGTGKELVARAIGMSQYVPFDSSRQRFGNRGAINFLPLNLSALSPTLIESELFGHRQGSFTGADSDRIGWLESCSRHGAVFLDEIGELDLGLQVKLLRVLQNRTYNRMGESSERTFAGKIIAATNRDLVNAISKHEFREDFYFRICSDRIETPSLQEQLAAHPDDLYWLVDAVVAKQFGVRDEELAIEIGDWILRKMGRAYSWNGNMRELEQCVRSYIIRADYTPFAEKSSAVVGSQRLPACLATISAGNLTAEELLSRYATWLYAQHGSYERVAATMKLDRRTVKAKIDATLLAELKSLQ